MPPSQTGLLASCDSSNFSRVPPPPPPAARRPPPAARRRLPSTVVVHACVLITAVSLSDSAEGGAAAAPSRLAGPPHLRPEQCPPISARRTELDTQPNAARSSRGRSVRAGRTVILCVTRCDGLDRGGLWFGSVWCEDV